MIALDAINVHVLVPVNCIEIETVKSIPGEDLGITSNGKKKALWVTTFNIDFAKCCYCQLCVFPCPTECIYMTDVYEFSEFQRENLVFDFVTLLPEERGFRKRKTLKSCRQRRKLRKLQQQRKQLKKKLQLK
jgi:NADH-quinone oxidoreductase subunit I